MEKDNISYAIGGALLGFTLACIWMKLNSIENQITQKPYGKHITTEYDSAGRLVDYLEMPIESDLGVGALLSHGLQHTT